MMLLVRFGRNIGYEHELLVYKLLKPQVGEFLSVSRPLDSAERKIRPAHIRIVDEDHPCLDTARDAFGPLYISGVDRPPEAKRRIVCNRDRFSFVLRREDKRDGAKEFLFVCGIVRGETSEYSRLQECPDCSCPVSAEQNFRSMSRCVINLPQDKLQRTVRRERPEGHAFVERVSQLQLFCGSNEAREELLKHRFDNDESLCADACLSVVSDPSEDGHGHGMVEVGVVEDNECIAST